MKTYCASPEELERGDEEHLVRGIGSALAGGLFHLSFLYQGVPVDHADIARVLKVAPSINMRTTTVTVSSVLPVSTMAVEKPEDDGMNSEVLPSIAWADEITGLPAVDVRGVKSPAEVKVLL